MHQVTFSDLLEPFAKDTVVVQRGEGHRSCMCLADTTILSHASGARAIVDELGEMDQAEVVFELPGRVSGAQLLVFDRKQDDGTWTAPMQVMVNSSAPMGHYSKALSDSWRVLNIPGSELRRGSNSFRFIGAGCLFIDPSSSDGTARTSRRSFDDGACFHPGSLGSDGSIDGEYLVRLLLPLYPTAGEITSPIVDCVRPTEEYLPASILNQATKATVECKVPAGTRIRVDARVGSTPFFSPRHWTGFAPTNPPVIEQVDEAKPLAVEVATRSSDRFVQVRLTLESSDGGRTTPEVHVVTIKSAVDIASQTFSSSCVKVVGMSQPTSLQCSACTFRYAGPSARLDRMRKLWNLDDVVASGQTELRRFEQLRLWSHSQWNLRGVGEQTTVATLDAMEILDAQKGGWGVGDERHQVAVFVGCAVSLGWVSRIVMLGLHWVAEVYSTEHEKWICQDVSAGHGVSCVYHRGDSDSPMSALEIQQAILSDDVVDVFADVTDLFGSRGVREGAYVRRSEALSTMPILSDVEHDPNFGLVLCNTHTAEPATAATNLAEGTDQCFAKGALWFTGDGEDAPSPFVMQTARVADIEPSVNQLRLVVHQALPTDDERVKIARSPGAKRLAKVEVHMGHTCPNFSHALIRVGSPDEDDEDDDEEDMARESKEVTQQQLPMVLWLPRGEASISARAVNTFGVECSRAAVQLLIALRPDSAATAIQAAARGYQVRHSGELIHWRRALAKLREAPEALPVQKTATKMRSLYTATVSLAVDSNLSHVIYTVMVYDGGQLLRSVPRRYSEFHALRTKVLELLRGHFMGESVSLIQFPTKKTVRGKTSDKLTQQRASMLQSWLNMMFEIELRCRADRPQLQTLLLRWAGVTATPM